MIIPETVKKILQSKKELTVLPVKFSAAKVKWRANRCNSLEDFVNLAFNPSSAFPFSIRPSQVKEEIIELLKILARRKPKFILEIGTARGGTLFLFARVSSPDATILSVDLPIGYHEPKVPLYKSFAIQNQKITLIRENSHDSSALKMVEKVLEGHKLNFLFIDGDHTYEGVKRDFEMYSPLVKKGGIVMWTKISSKFLALVLRRIEEVIPSKVVGKKIITDDHSTDNTVQIARSLGWEVYENPGSRIFGAFETALRLGSSEFFISVDLICF